MRVYELENGHLLIATPDKTGLTDGDQTWEIERFDFVNMTANIDDPEDLWTIRELNVFEKTAQADRILAKIELVYNLETVE